MSIGSALTLVKLINMGKVTLGLIRKQSNILPIFADNKEYSVDKRMARTHP